MVEEFGLKLSSWWDRVALPTNHEDDSFEFVNRVVAAEWFADKTEDIAKLAQLNEAVLKQIKNFKVAQERLRRQVKTFRRKVLAKHYNQMTKSASPEVQDAFILRCAIEDGEEAELLALEDEIEQLEFEIERRVPFRDMVDTRMKTLQLAMESAKQYLDAEKLEAKIRLGRNV
jgi:hypothetical protein